MESLWKKTPEYPQFKDLFIEENPLFEDTFSKFQPVIPEFTLTNYFVSRKAYRIKVGRFQKFLCLLSVREERSFFFPPLGKENMIKWYDSIF